MQNLCLDACLPTFILSMLASIFSCSTSFLACAMLAVLLLAMGAVTQVLCVRCLERRRRFGGILHVIL